MSLLLRLFYYLQSMLPRSLWVPTIEPKEPFDIVITWVDWSNKYFVEQMLAVGGRSEGCESGEFIELKYLLRSIEKQKVPYRYIHIVHSDNHPPPKYLKETDRLFFVPHSKIVRDESYLPLIHRESINIHLHRIPHLADHFFYLYDDMVILDKRIFLNAFYDFHQKRVKVARNKMNLAYDVTQSQGLWLQSTINAHRIILGNQFNEQNYGDSIMLDHNITLLNKTILTEIEKKYQKQFLTTASYQNQKEEREKEKDLVCLISFYNNYLTYNLGFKPLRYHPNFVSRIHTNGVTDESKKEIQDFKTQLSYLKRYLSANFQGNGISDEYPSCDKIRSIYLDWLNREFPTPTPFERKT